MQTAKQKLNGFLVEHAIKNKISQSLKHKHRSNIHENRNSKTSESHKFVINLLQKLDLRSLDKHFALQNLFITHLCILFQ